MLNTFVDAGFWVEQVLEPQLTPEQKISYPHKQQWMSRYLGIIIFRVRPLLVA